MLRRRPFTFFFSLLILLALSACSNIKYLPKGEELYIGADVKIESKEKIEQKARLKEELEETLVPKPNSTFLKLRPRLWLYNLAERTKNKKIKNRLLKKGEPPVLFSSVSVKTTIDLLKNRLFNNGYFFSKIDTNIIHKNRKVKIEYIAKVGTRYTINEIFYPEQVNDITTSIAGTKENSLLKKDEVYNLNVLKGERTRIDAELKNQGFFYFNPDFLFFKVDTTVGGKKLNVHLSIKPETPSQALKIYTLNNIYVYPEYSLEKDSLNTPENRRLINTYYYHLGDSMFYPPVILRSVFLKTGDPYSRDNHNMTLKRLTGLGVFKFVNIRFKEVDSLKSTLLDCFIYMTPLPKKSLRLELQAVSKSNNFVGPALLASYRNRNFMRRAGLFVFSLNTGYETQLSKWKSGFNSYEIGGDMSLQMPRFITPFNIGYESKLFVPKTRINMGFRFLNRVEYFSMTALNFNYGYSWRESGNKEHELSPISINYVQLNKTFPAFKAILDQNIQLRKSFERQFILGSIYSYTYTSPAKDGRENNLYFRGNIDVSGNAIHLVQSVFNAEKTEAGSYRLFNIDYSQYSKLDIDFRYTFNLGRKHSFVTRLIGGAGLPYGNSSTMPYIKQFFSGGPNSIRAFRTRSVGPGSFNRPDSIVAGAFTDQAGDMKLEGNLEYRFDIYKIVKGAVFGDAGNIWLTHDNPDMTNGKFNHKTFLSQLAVGTGFGIRFDVSFFVLRFDLAFPVRKPFLPPAERWVFNRISFGDPSWRRENLILNIAIGYPF